MKRFFNIFSLLILALVFNVASMYAEPSTQARNIAFSDLTSTSAKITWLNGNGGKRIVAVYSNNTYTTPTDGIDYNASAQWGTGSVLGSGYVVYDGSGSTRTVTVTGLTSGTTYYVRVYEYNDVPNDFDYNVNTATNNPRSFTTSIATPSGLNTTNITANTANINWNTVSGATGYIIQVNGTDYNTPTDIGNYTSFYLTNLTKNSNYSWTVAAYRDNYDVSDFANNVNFTTLNDITPPTFAVAYYSDNNYQNTLFTLNGVVGAGTFYQRIKSNEKLSGSPTLTIATLGTLNDKTTQTTKQITDTLFAYTRQVVVDAGDDGSTNEVVSVTGTDLNGNTTTNQALNGLKIDTKAPTITNTQLVDNYTLNVTFSEGVRHSSSSFSYTTGSESNVELNTGNFVVTLVDNTNSGVTGVSVTNVTKNSSSSYTLTLSYNALNATYGGAPYQGNPGITLNMSNTEDLIGNAYSSPATSKTNLFITPVRNISKAKYYTSLSAAVIDANSSNSLLLAPTTISEANAITTNKSLAIDGFATTTLNIANDITFTTGAYANFTGNQGKYTITATAPTASLEFISCVVDLNNLTLNADVNVNGLDIDNFTGIDLTVNKNITVTGNYTTIDNSTFTSASGTALSITNASADIYNSSFANNSTAISYAGDFELYVLNLLGTNISNATVNGINSNNSVVSIDGGNFTNNKTFLTSTGNEGYLTIYNSSINGTNVANNNVGFNITGSQLVLDNVDVLNNVTGISATNSVNGISIMNTSSISNNTTGINSSNSAIDIYDNSTIGNNTTGISISGSSIGLTMNLSTISNNTTGVNSTNSPVYFEESTISGNTTAVTFNGASSDFTSNLSNLTGNTTVFNLISSNIVTILSNNFGTSNTGVVLTNVTTSAQIEDNKFNTGKIAITNNSNKTVDAVSNYYGSVNGPTVLGGSINNPCGNGATINGTGITSYEPWYYDNTLTTTASNVTNNVASTSTPEYCAYPGSQAQFTGTMPSGGYGGYTYQWFNGANPISGATSQNLSNYTLDVAGTYTITRKVTSNGCTYTSNTVTVIVNPLPNVPTITGLNSFCYESSTTLSVSNIQSGITYQWFKGANPIIGATNTSVVINGTHLTGGETANFRVEGTTNKGCIITSSNYSVTRLPEITVTINGGAASYTACRDGISPLTTTITPNGDTYTYQWYNNNILISGATSSSYTPTASGTHKVIATNVTTGRSCTDEDDISVTINELPTTPVIAGDMTACYNGSVTLSVSNYVAGDLANYSLTWFNSSNVQVGTGLTYVVDFANIAGTSASYYVVAKNLVTLCDKESAGFPSSYTVTELPQFFVSVSNVSYCSNVAATSLQANVTGGSLGDTYSYQWYNNLNQPVGTGSTFTHVGTTPGNYTYYVIATLTTNNEGCIAQSNNATVTIYPLADPVVQNTSTSLVCKNQTISLTSANNNGAATVSSYQWLFNDTPLTNGGGISGATSANLTITNAQLSAQGNYKIRMTTNNGCVTTSSAFYVEMTELASITGFSYTTHNNNVENEISHLEATNFNQYSAAPAVDGYITYVVKADSAVDYNWYLNGNPLPNGIGTITQANTSYKTQSSLKLTYTDIVNFVGSESLALFSNTYTVHAVAVSANSCANSAPSNTANLKVIPVPTYIVIEAIPTRTDGNPGNDANIPANNTDFNVRISARNNLGLGSAVLSDTRLSLSLSGDATVTSLFNNGGNINIANGDSTVTFPVKLTKTIGAVGLTIKAFVDDANTDSGLMDNMKGSDGTGVKYATDTIATSNEFVLIPTKPLPPTNFRRTARSKTTITMAWSISTSIYNSLLLVKRGNAYTTEIPEDGKSYSGSLFSPARSVQNFGNGTNANDLNNDTSNGYRAIYFGNARTIIIQGLTSNTEYNTKVYAVAGDFSSAAKEQTNRYSDDYYVDLVGTTNDTITYLPQKTMPKETVDDFVEYGDNVDAPFTVDAVYPNPVRDEVNFTINSSEAASYKVEIMSANGQIVSVPFSELVLAAGSHTQNFKIEGLAAGSYMLMFTSGEFATVIPIVVMP